MIAKAFKRDQNEINKIRRERSQMKIKELLKLNQSFSFTRLKRLPSKVEENKKISFKRLPMQHQKISTYNQSILNTSLCCIENNQKAEKTINDSKKKLRLLSAKQLTPAKPLRYVLEKTVKTESLLDSLGKSQKLIEYMEKLGRPCLTLNENSLWSKEIQKRQDFFNTSVYNSSLITKKVLKNLTIK
jgi:hypothetical protein